MRERGGRGEGICSSLYMSLPISGCLWCVMNRPFSSSLFSSFPLPLLLFRFPHLHHRPNGSLVVLDVFTQRDHIVARVKPLPHIPRYTGQKKRVHMCYLSGAILLHVCTPGKHSTPFYSSLFLPLSLSLARVSLAPHLHPFASLLPRHRVVLDPDAVQLDPFHVRFVLRHHSVVAGRRRSCSRRCLFCPFLRCALCHFDLLLCPRLRLRSRNTRASPNDYDGRGRRCDGKRESGAPRTSTTAAVIPLTAVCTCSGVKGVELPRPARAGAARTQRRRGRWAPRTPGYCARKQSGEERRHTARDKPGTNFKPMCAPLLKEA